MLKLRGKVQTFNLNEEQPRLVRLTRNASLPSVLRHQTALLIKSENAESLKQDLEQGKKGSSAFAAILFCGTESEWNSFSSAVLNTPNLYVLPAEYEYLDDGDIVRINPVGQSISALFRKKAPNNSILLTERCNHLCLMCSQPPKDIDDSYLIDEAFELIRMIPQSATNIGFTGGEPTLYGDRFIELVETAKRSLPETSLDVLTNGRAFKNETYAAKLGQIKHSHLQLGIPLYSDDPVRHDYIVQAQGAFDETIHGILNLKRYGVKVEIRVVVHQQTLPRLVQTCEFISRNLLFVDHVALMGLEITGFTRANLDILWTDPYDYRDTLSEAAGILRSYGMHCSIYNHQLCLINRDLEPIYRKSISDWKNEYLPECGGCVRKQDCGGFFSTQVMYRHSQNIRPFL